MIATQVEASPQLAALFRLADAEAAAVAGTTSPNPPVGALIVEYQPTAGGAELPRVLGRGATQPPGQAHAEVMALRDAGGAARGAWAIVTLEPCNHTGRTGPCAEALIAAGVRRVDYLFADPNPQAEGGADTLRAAGIEVHGPYASLTAPAAADTPTLAGPWQARWTLEPWLRAITAKRPSITLKLATTLDGKVAARNRTSQWITGSASRHAAHADRARRDAILVGTGTVLADNPSLTARQPDGTTYPAAQQPIPVVMGERELPATATLAQPERGTLRLATHSVPEVLAALRDAGVIDVLVEGGPTIASAFLAAGVVDEIHHYMAPSVLGGAAHSALSPAAIPGLTGEDISDLTRYVPRELHRHGDDIQWVLTAQRPSTSPSPGAT